MTPGQCRPAHIFGLLWGAQGFGLFRVIREIRGLNPNPPPIKNAKFKVQIAKCNPPNPPEAGSIAGLESPAYPGGGRLSNPPKANLGRSHKDTRF